MMSSSSEGELCGRPGNESGFRSVVIVGFNKKKIKNEMLFYLPSSPLPGLSDINVGVDSKGLLCSLRSPKYSLSPR